MITQYELNTVEQLKECLNKLIKQAIHDIQSPLSSLLMLGMANKTSKLNPNDLKARIDGILNSIVQPFKDTSDRTDTDQIIVIPDLIEKIIAEKECEYANLPVIFKSNISDCADGISILGNIDDFSRMLSNLINNAVEACSSKFGIITINCERDDNKSIKIIIEDNGQGMPENIKNQILNNKRVTDKISGQGLGLTHTRETLARSGGNLDIQSKPGHGTKIILTFPFTSEIHIDQNKQFSNNPNILPPVSHTLKQVDIVIVEDDKIHSDILAMYMLKDKNVDVFNFAKEFLANFNKYSLETKMLIDYQFPEENINGVDIYKELHNKGFTNCYLYTGMEFDAGELPSYIKTILKTDHDAIKRLINS